MLSYIPTQKLSVKLQNSMQLNNIVMIYILTGHARAIVCKLNALAQHLFSNVNDVSFARGWTIEEDSMTMINHHTVLIPILYKCNRNTRKGQPTADE